MDDTVNRLNRKIYSACLLGICACSSAIGAPVGNIFENATEAAGLTGVPAYRISIADVNGDGYPDLLLHASGNENIGDVKNKQSLYLNVSASDPADPGRRMFINFTQASGIRATRAGAPDGRHSSFTVFADVDNDGDLDMFSGVYVHRPENYIDIGDRNDLFLNDGTGRFTLADDLGFHNEGLQNTSSATFVDYDLDGNIDLFVGNWRANPFYLSYPDQLYRGNGDGSFENVTTAAGITAYQPTYSVSTADANGDGLMDLFAPNYCRGQSIHWHNNGDGTFSQRQATSNYGLYIGVPGAFGSNTCSWGSMPRDYDNDGDVDFFEIITHGSETGNAIHSTVLRNDDGIFTWDLANYSRTTQAPPVGTLDIPDVTDRDPYHHGDHYATWIDLQNTGQPSLVLSECCYGDNHSLYIFTPQGSGGAYTLTALPELSSLTPSASRVHNVSSFDYDLDGDQDLIIGFASDQGLQLWRNTNGDNHNWIKVKLKGAGIENRSNVSAIGALVTVEAAGATYTETVYAGNGHFGPQEPLSLNFGLGNADQVERITVHWPNKLRSKTTVHDVSVNQIVYLEELVGDVNGDNCVDRGDVTAIMRHLRGRSSYNALYDLNNDDIVTIADARYVFNYFSLPRGAACD